MKRASVVFTEPCEPHIYAQLVDGVDCDLPTWSPEVLYHYLVVPPDLLYSVVELPDGTTFAEAHEDLADALCRLPKWIALLVQKAMR